MSDEVLERFLNSLGIHNTMDFDLDLEFCGRNAANRKVVDFIIKKHTPWTFEQYEQFTMGLQNIDYQCSFCFSYVLKPTAQEIFDFFMAYHQSLYRLPYKLEIKLGINELTFVYNCRDQFLENEYKLQNFKECLQFLNYDILINHEIFDETELIVVEDNITSSYCSTNQEELEEENEDEMPDVKEEEFEPEKEIEEELEVKEVEEERVKKSHLSYLNSENRESFPMPKGGGFFTHYQSISQLVKPGEFVSVNAQIFFIDKPYELRGEKKAFLYKIGVKDELGNAIYLEVISGINPCLKEKYISNFRLKDNVKASGIIKINNTNQERIIDVRFLELLDPSPMRYDFEENKRVELHLHTKMSALDGVSTISDYIKLAKHMGHTAIALTDHGSVQSFPEAQEEARKQGIKVLYGAELFMVDDHLPYISNPRDELLSNSSFIAFDLETTGLSAHYDRIIEIGAVKVVNGIQTGNLSLLINPQKKLSQGSIRVTKLDDETLKGQPILEDVIDEVLAFFGDLILVSHNASFDIDFLNEALIRMNRPILSNPGVDTLSLSRFLFPNSKSHRLEALAKRAGVEYNHDLAHRALYDAEVLRDIWITMIGELENIKSGLSHADLENMISNSEMIKHARPSHVVVLAKNRKGIQDLYELISLSHVEYISGKNGVPKTPRSELVKRRENLLLGSACFNGEIFDTAQTKSEAVLREKMEFYDYIEVQPLECYQTLIDNDSIESKELLVQFILDIIKNAKILNKPIVATGDAHYVNPEEKIFRDVYIYTEGLGGKAHPLFYRDINGKPLNTPMQHFRSTKEMKDAFSFLNDDELVHEIVVTNPNLIADMISKVDPVIKKLHTPVIENSAELLRELCYNTAHDLYGKPLPNPIELRLERELKGIIDNGYAVVYYIAHKIIAQANADGEIVGSRGSVGSSLVATMAKITEVNPLAPHYRCPKCKHFEFSSDPLIFSGYDLPLATCPHCGTTMIGDGQNIPFETFLGFDADKVPDIDLNFSENYQAKAHDYTKVLLGEGNVYRAGTIGTVALKTAKAKAHSYFEMLYGKKHATYAQVDMIASGCIDVKRTSGQHPGGIVVVPNGHDVNEFSPIQYPADDKESLWKTTHFAFESLHDALLKLDLLGHVDPYALRLMTELTNIKTESIPLNDKKVLSLFSNREGLIKKSENKNFLKEKTGALGIPEFGTNFVRQILHEAKPQTVGDLIAISGLSHGTDVWQGNAQSLIKTGEMNLHQVIACRDDIMVYLMSKGLDSLLAFKIMEDVRKGKKVKKEYAQIMKDHGVPNYYIDSCNKIKYMFPKAHAVAYVTMALRVGYFKVYKPLVYYAVYFSVRTDKYDIDAMLGGFDAICEKVKELQEKHKQRIIDNREKEILSNLMIAVEMHERGYKFLPLDLNRSDSKMFIIDEENKGIIPPFCVVDSLGPAVAQSIVEQREIKPYSSKEDFVKRARVSTTVLKKLEELNLFKNVRESDSLNLFDFFS